MTTWYALDMDDGVKVQAETKEAILTHLQVRDFPVCKITQNGKDDYHVLYGYDEEDIFEFDLLTHEVAQQQGYGWAVDP